MQVVDFISFHELFRENFDDLKKIVLFKLLKLFMFYNNLKLFMFKTFSKLVRLSEV